MWAFNPYPRELYVSSGDTDANHQLTALEIAITRAILSPDGEYIAAVASQSQIQIIRCPAGEIPTRVYVASIISRQAQKVLAHATLLRWSPEVYSLSQDQEDEDEADPRGHLLRIWLLVSDGQRLLCLGIDLDLHGSSDAICTILADYDLGSHLASFAFADFVFSHEHAVLIQNMGIQASVISLKSLERHDITNIKYADARGFATRSGSSCFSVLTRSDGQDSVVVFTITEMGSLKCSSFSPMTYDAQGIKWCPNSDPILCVWDSAAFGLKVSFFTANGHHLRQMDLDSHSLVLSSTTSDFEGLGINTVEWLSCYGKEIFAVFDTSSQLLLQTRSMFRRVRLAEVSV